jgi:hypothetical protein
MSSVGSVGNWEASLKARDDARSGSFLDLWFSRTTEYDVQPGSLGGFCLLVSGVLNTKALEACGNERLVRS